MVKEKLGILFAAAMLVNCLGSISGYAQEGKDSIAEFVYTGGTAQMMFGGDKDSGYPATGGAAKDVSRLFASLDGTSNAPLQWSKAEYLYGGNAVAVVPIMAADTDNLWGTAPYFLVSTSTVGYENITFSAAVSGTKKGPKNYKLQYSTDGSVYNDIVSASVGTNKDLDENKLFDNVSVPENASDSNTVYFKIIATSTATIGGSTFSGNSGGEAAINDIKITGTVKSGTTPTLESPTASAASGELFGGSAVEFTAADGAEIYYSTDGTNFVKYTEPLYPFKNNLKTGVELTVYASKDGYNDSVKTTYTYTCYKDELAGFCFNSADDIKYVNGKIEAVSGIYGDAKMTASIDTVNKYVPMYDNEGMNAVVIAPDDGVKWTDGTYWQFELSTRGSSKVYISADACSSKKGPSSMTLQYSTDGVNFKNVSGYVNKPFSDNTLEHYYDNVALPDDAANIDKLYVRIASLEDMSLNNGEEAIWGTEKGNTYINNVEFLCDRNATLKMPVTTKKTEYFGANGTVKYTSYDGADMKYNIYDKNGDCIVSEVQYPNGGIALSQLPQFDAVCSNEFRIEIWSEKDGERSAASSRVFKYKGDDIALFDVDETTAAGETSMAATGGASAQASTISMKPNGQDDISLSTDKSNIRAAASEENTWNFDKTRTAPSSDGGWIIKTSTKGYKDIVFTAEQASTSKGPRDFALAYSLDGENFKNITSSSVKLTESMESTYSNFPLPEETENRDTVYIKIKIDGGETVSGLEMTSSKEEYETDTTKYVYGKGNTDINGIEVCGTPIESKIYVSDDEIKKGGVCHVYYDTAENSFTVLAVAYNDGQELISCKRVTDNKFNIPSDAAHIKLMMWDSLGGQKPLAKSLYKEVK